MLKRLSLDVGRERWGLELEDGWVWELESSSGSKWSRHIIVRVPGAAFAHNLAMGAFVQDLMSLPQVLQLCACGLYFPCKATVGNTHLIRTIHMQLKEGHVVPQLSITILS